METDEYIATLAKEGGLLVEASRNVGAGTPVPTCPEWALRDLLAHVGFVHRWATAYVAKGLTEMVDEPAEEDVLARGTADDELVPWVDAGHRALVEALSSAPADLQCWTFLPSPPPSPSPLAFWARRQAHETTVHRVDAELAAGRTLSSIGTSFAVDGIDELLLGFLARPRSRRLPKLVPGVVRFGATDTGDSWTVRIFPDRMETTRGPTTSASTSDIELSVRAPACDLYLLLWNRCPRAGMDVAGREDLLDQWAEQVRVIW